MAGTMIGFASGCASTKGGGNAPGDENAVVHTATAEDLAFVKSTEPVSGKRVVLFINGMGCPLCVTNVDRQLLRLDAVESVDVDLGLGTAVANLHEGVVKPTPREFHRAVDNAGLTLVKMSVQ